ncbi:hypothetical protein CCR75_004206 [Bremia lactucae]|uniref:RxLR effector protein n=1 Tax=Bremia lactucae TaxID=4779 RepID=A0A976IDA5_BRELC|nr:hypothetical protein CCR75_004206 [Bremia lactucae]
MVRVYVAALAAIFALSASATLHLTLANASSVTTEEGDGRPQGKLRVNAATNVESDERFLDGLKALVRGFYDLTPFAPRFQKDTYSNLLLKLNLSFEQFSGKDTLQLRRLYDAARRHNKVNPTNPVSVYTGLVEKYGEFEIVNMVYSLKHAQSSKSRDVLKRLGKEEKWYWKDKKDAGKMYAEALDLGNEFTVKNMVSKLSKLEQFLNRIDQKASEEQLKALVVADIERVKTKKESVSPSDVEM